MKFQDIRIKIQQTKSILKIVIEVVIALQVIFYFFMFYKINYKIYAVIKTLINEHYPLKQINWGLVLKDLNFKSPLLYSLLVDLLLVPAVYLVLKNSSGDPVNENKNEKIIRGSTVESVKKYKKTVDYNDVFCTIGDVPLTIKIIYRNILVLGATGSGKTQIILKILFDSYNRFDYNGIIYDSKKDSVPVFYNPKYDIIFNPADDRCPAWNILDEVENKADAATLAEVLVPEPDASNPNGFFITNARHILEAMILYLKMKGLGTNENLIKIASKTPEDLLKLFKSDPEVEKQCIMAITPLQSEEVRSMMTEISRYLKAFTIMPSKPDKEGMKTFNITKDFLKKRKTRIFFNLDKNSEIFVKPIMKIFMELLIKKFLSAPDGENTPTLFLFDELSNFDKTPSIMDLLDKGRSKNASVIVGIQDKAKTEFVYGHDLTMNMMNSCNSAIYLRVNSNDEAEYVSRQIGSQEVERTSESDSVTDEKYTHSKSTQIVEKKLFLPSQILKWQDLEAVVKLVNIPYFMHINLVYQAYTKINEGLISSNRLYIPKSENKQNSENQQAVSDVDSEITDKNQIVKNDLIEKAKPVSIEKKQEEPEKHIERKLKGI